MFGYSCIFNPVTCEVLVTIGAKAVCSDCKSVVLCYASSLHRTSRFTFSIALAFFFRGCKPARFWFLFLLIERIAFSDYPMVEFRTQTSIDNRVILGSVFY
jgi:hypothetical protein